MLHYRQYCAVARALEVLGERWTLLIVRELLIGPATVNDLREAFPRLSRTTMTTRLNGLVKSGIVASDDLYYSLTDEGQRLAPVVRELARWAIDAGSTQLTEGTSRRRHARLGHAPPGRSDRLAVAPRRPL